MTIIPAGNLKTDPARQPADGTTPTNTDEQPTYRGDFAL